PRAGAAAAVSVGPPGRVRAVDARVARLEPAAVAGARRRVALSRLRPGLPHSAADAALTGRAPACRDDRRAGSGAARGDDRAPGPRRVARGRRLHGGAARLPGLLLERPRGSRP